MPQPKLLVMLSLATLIAYAMPVLGAEERDHERARDLYVHGDIHSLADILQRAGKSTNGDVVDVDLVRRDGPWIYRLEVVMPDGHRTTIEIPAAIGDGDEKAGRSGGR